MLEAMGYVVPTGLWIMMVFCAHSINIEARSRRSLSAGELERNTDDMVAAILQCRDIVGLSLAVVKGNQTLLTKGYGRVNLEAEAEVTETTLFGIASLTKAFTATLLGQVLTEHE